MSGLPEWAGQGADSLVSLGSGQHSPQDGDEEGDARGSAKTSRSSPSSQMQEPALHDPELAVVVTAWHDLPAAVRAGIAAMVRAART